MMTFNNEKLKPSAKHKIRKIIVNFQNSGSNEEKLQSNQHLNSCLSNITYNFVNLWLKPKQQQNFTKYIFNQRNQSFNY